MSEFERSPSTAAILNFFIWGLGYVYLGKAWGALLVVLDIILMFIISIGYFLAGFTGAISKFGTFDLMLNLFFLVISVVLAWHAYQMAKESIDKGNEN